MIRPTLFLLLLWAPGLLAAQTYTVTEPEAKTLAEKIEASVNKGDATVLSAALYTPELLHRMWQQLETPAEPAFKAGFASSFKSRDIASQFISNIEKGSYHLLRFYQKNNIPHLIFRSFGEHGLNYHDFVLFKVKDSVKIADMYVFITGEDFSTTMAGLVVEMTSGKGGKSENQARIETMLQIKALKAKGAYAELKTLIEAQSVTFRNNKAIQTLYLNACQQLDDESYTKALENYNITFPQASNAYLLMLDLYYSKKEVQKGLHAVDKIDSILGGDPLLNLYRGNFLMLEDKYEEANKLYEKVFAYDPSIYLNMAQLVFSHALMNQFDKAKEVINKYKKIPGYQQAVIDDLYQNIPDLKE